MITLPTDTSHVAALQRLKTLGGIAGELQDRVAAEAEHALSCGAAELLAACGLDRLLVGLCTVEYGHGAPDEFLKVLGYRTLTGHIEAAGVTDACATVSLPAGTRPLTALLEAYAAAAVGVADTDSSWRLLLTTDGAVRLPWEWDDHVNHDLDLRDHAPPARATYHALLAGEIAADSARMTIAGSDVRVFTGAGATSLTVSVPAVCGVERLAALDEFHARVGALARHHAVAASYSPGRRLDMLAAALCTGIDTTVLRDEVSLLTEGCAALTTTVPVELLRRAQRALASDNHDIERRSLAELTAALAGADDRATRWVITLRLAEPATRPLRDALIAAAGGAACWQHPSDDAATTDVQVSVDDDSRGVSVTVAACQLGVAQHVARSFLRYCAALGVEVAELVSIVPAP